MTITITDMNRCTGCAACANACPSHAITMRENEEGFYKPVIDEKLCVQCQICEKTCPQNYAHDKNSPVPQCFAFMAEDALRLKSSSGGAFGILAREFLRRGGVVVGAAFDEHWQVRHIIAETEAELEKLRSSKYVQSFMSETLLKNVRELLEKDVPVLFSGVPCQVAGLLNYLDKEYDKLCTVDLLCAYAPSPKAWRQYLEENYADIPLAAINMRDKSIHGWECARITFTETCGSIVSDQKYMTPYLERMFKGSHCAQCAYKRLPRPGDFTLGDFWRIQQHAPDCDDKKGTSGVLLNNKKAEHLFASLTEGIKLKKAMPLHTLSWQLFQEPHRIPACLDFFKHINDKTFNVNSREAHKNTRVGITNWWFINNRGAILTNYALNEMVNSLGYNALTINYISPHERHNFFHKGYVKKFSDTYIKRTRWLENRRDLRLLNNDIHRFVLGSDQIFNYFPCNSHGKQYYGWWVDAKNNKLISYAASFCNDSFHATEAQKNLVRHFLKRFDHHSIREVEGVEIMKNTFGLEAQFVLDPVFCIDKKKYLNIAEKATDKPDEDFIAYYITLPDRIKSQDLQKLLDWTLKKTGCTKAIDLFSWDISMENWLWYFIHAKFIVTNSFHGACLSLIFNKPYLVYAMDGKHDSRFSTIARIGGQKERIFYHLGDIYHAEWLFDKVDFSYFNSTIQKRIDESYAWLKNALDSPKKNTLTEEEDIYDALINDYDEKIAQVYGYVNNKVSVIEESLKKAAEATGIQNYIKELLRKTISDIEAQMKKH